MLVKSSKENFPQDAYAKRQQKEREKREGRERGREEERKWESSVKTVPYFCMLPTF